MKNKYLLSCALVALAALAGTLAAYPHLPANVPIHWNMQGEVDRFGSRGSVFMPVALMFVFMALWAVLPAISPRRFTVEGFRSTWWYTCLALVAMLAYIQLVLLLGATTRDFDVGRFMLGGLAVFISLLGNVMGKVRRNFWLGVRTPWTLADERVWYATHRLTAKWMVATGLLALAASLLGLPPMAAVSLILAGPLVPAGWSLVYYKRLERGGDSAG